MKKFCTRTIAMLSALFFGLTPAWAVVDILHQFDGGAGGSAPNSPLANAETGLFGSTATGGTSDAGVLYRLDHDGGGFLVANHFDVPSDPMGVGSLPSGRLAIAGSQVFGTATLGGQFFDGVLYQVDISGSGYSIVHDFDMSSSPTVLPTGGLIADGSTLYGTTELGDLNTEGSVFKIETGGNGFQVLHTLDGNGDDGIGLVAPVTLAGGFLYGVAPQGGLGDEGTVFRVDTSGNNFSVLKEFGAGVIGSMPSGGLLETEGTLYGVARRGGVTDNGVLYSLLDDGTGYQALHEFQSGAADGAAPLGELTLVGDRLFGVTEAGGPSNFGTIYSIGLDGSGFQLHHAFSDVDGRAPQAGLTLDPIRELLFGTTAAGGADGAGVAFALDPNRITGDFNNDGIVNAADYTVWRDSLGSDTLLDADADFNGVVGASDYLLWKSAFGNVADDLFASSSTLAHAVPEPSTLLLVILGFGWRLVLPAHRQ